MTKPIPLDEKFQSLLLRTQNIILGDLKTNNSESEKDLIFKIVSAIDILAMIPANNSKSLLQRAQLLRDIGEIISSESVIDKESRAFIRTPANTLAHSLARDLIAIS